MPELSQAAQPRFGPQRPTATLWAGPDWVERWDAEDFDPWMTRRWPTVRVLRDRQHKPDGQVVEADWLTDFPAHQVGPRARYGLAKSHWEIENHGFNDAKTRYGLEHIRHHHANSLLIGWLVVALAMTIERLYRLRFLHRGTHRVQTAVTLLLQLWLSLGSPQALPDTS